MHIDRFACDNDGAATDLRVDAGSSAYRRPYRLRLDNCDRNGYHLNVEIQGVEPVLCKLETASLNIKALPGDEDWHFTQGQLSVSADDGSYLELVEDGEVADPAQPASGRAILVRNNEGEFVIEQPWTTWRSRFDAARSMICAE